MAGSKVNNYGVGDVNLSSLMGTTDEQRKGFSALSLTNYENTSEPAIEAGSVLEVGGALFEFESEEAITVTPADGVVYVKVVPAGASITAEFTATAPTWDPSKFGWYGTAGNASHRYVGVMVQSGTGTVFASKQLIKKISVPGRDVSMHYSKGDDATARTFDTTSYVDEPNLEIELEVAVGDIIKVLLMGETKTVGGTADCYLKLEDDNGLCDRYMHNGTNAFLAGDNINFRVASNASAFEKFYYIEHYRCTSAGTAKFAMQGKRTGGADVLHVQNRYMFAEKVF